MISAVCVIHDRTSGVWSIPVFYHNDSEALRHFAMQVSYESQSVMAFKPEDFTLWRVGSYDDATGEITGLPEPYKIAIGDMVRMGGTV